MRLYTVLTLGALVLVTSATMTGTRGAPLQDRPVPVASEVTPTPEPLSGPSIAALKEIRDQKLKAVEEVVKALKQADRDNQTDMKMLQAFTQRSQMHLDGGKPHRRREIVISAAPSLPPVEPTETPRPTSEPKGLLNRIFGD